MNKFITIFSSIFLFQAIFADAQPTKENVNGVTIFKEAKFKKSEVNKPFYYIRHGQTDANKYGAAISDAPLNAEGILQVEKAAKLLKGKNIKIIIASPKFRTKQTAEIINKQLNVPIIYDDGLKEGRWKAAPGKTLNKQIDNKKIWSDGGDVVGVEESLYLFQMRIHNTIKAVVNKYDDVLIISHGRYLRYLTTLLNENPILKPKNAAPYYFTPIAEGTGNKLYNIEPIVQTKDNHGKSGRPGKWGFSIGEYGGNGEDAE